MVFSVLCICSYRPATKNSVQRGCLLRPPHPPQRTPPPRADTPRANTSPEQTPSQSRPPPGAETHPCKQCMLEEMGNKRVVCIHLKIFLFFNYKWKKIKDFVTSRNEVVAKVIFLHLSVILFTEYWGLPQ